MNLFFAIPLVFLSVLCYDRELFVARNSPQPHVKFATTEIIFVTIEILLLIVVNYECNVAT